MKNKTEKTVDYYESHADEIAVKYEHADVEHLHKFLLDTFRVGSKLLELGCGTGRDASFMQDQGYDVYGMDASKSMLRIAETLHPNLRGRLSCIRLPDEIGYCSDSFDGVYSCATLMHLSKVDIRKTLFNIREILKDNGILFFSVSVYRNGINKDGVDPAGRYFNEIAVDNWIAICQQAGFKVVSTFLSNDGLNRGDIKWLNCVAMKSSYKRMSEALKLQIVDALQDMGITYKGSALRGELFEIFSEKIGVLIDYNITNKNTVFAYSDYTKEQNCLMARYEKLFRFIVDETEDIKALRHDLKSLLECDFVEDGIKQRGANRAQTAIDPTHPEALFESAFEETYGRDALKYVTREYPIIDAKGETRWIDYFVKTNNIGIAIEKNGEVWHHPGIIGKRKYLSQLLKQNSIVAYGNKVYRWSLQNMQFKKSFSDEIRSYLGSSELFMYSHGITGSRSFAKYELYEHQKEILLQIENDRKDYGKNSFLVVLPTGTGKTEVMIRDIQREAKKTNNFKALVLVPQITLREQIQKELSVSLPFLTVGDDIDSNIFVKTYAWICRNFYAFNPVEFNYIVIDEAHHALAPSIKKAISYFTPNTLLGLTATDQRLDSQKLDEVFGTYEAQLSLKEAIESGILTNIKAFRLESNIDLSEVRYNGRDYITSDLQKTVIVDSRNKLIVDLLERYFVKSDLDQKSGIIFCVSIAHAKRIANLMQHRGISAKAIHGKDRNSDGYIELYQAGRIQFLCTCSLLNEGWDSPRTAVIVMARPTMSKVLYTQQIGRGTRKMEGKEALYVIDVVDNYSYAAGFRNNPWSIHSLLGISDYLPWGNVLRNNSNMVSGDELILAGLHEEERALKQIDIFTFENQYPDHLSAEQMARELFVSTGTLNNWIKNKKVEPSVSVPLGSKFIHYFAKEKISEIRKKMSLKVHDENTQYDDFFDFLKEGDYVYSYKMIMLLSFLVISDSKGECNLDSLVRVFSQFYLDRFKSNLPVDREKCPYRSIDYLDDMNLVKKSILQNPFEKFERKRFMYHCKDLNHIAFSPRLWRKINNETDLSKIKDLLFKDLIKYYESLGGLGNPSKLKEFWKI